MRREARVKSMPFLPAFTRQPSAFPPVPRGREGSRSSKTTPAIRKRALTGTMLAAGLVTAEDTRNRMVGFLEMTRKADFGGALAASGGGVAAGARRAVCPEFS